jgi:hypothetical protein
MVHDALDAFARLDADAAPPAVLSSELTLVDGRPRRRGLLGCRAFAWPDLRILKE